MKYRYYIIPPAREEFRVARRWYNKQGVNGLGSRFAQTVKDCILTIQQNPFAFSIHYRNVRIAHTRKFPYSIHFYLEEDEIIITAIIFQGRNPRIARSRI